MKPPTEDQRAAILDGVGGDEEAAERALRRIHHDLAFAEGKGLVDEERDPEETWVAVQCWASLASFAVAATYAPQSPMRYPGFSDGVTRWLTRIILVLSRVLARIGHALHSPSASVSVQFPWGLSVAVSWTL